MIEETLPGNRTKFKIVEAIYNNPKINITTLIKKVKASPNLVLKYVNNLLKDNIVKEERIGGIKKAHSRNISPDFKDEFAKITYSLIEIDKKYLFFKKYKQLKSISSQLEDLVNSKIELIIIYGSFARFSANKESDLDILIIGKLKKDEISKIKEIFITLEHEPSLKIETKHAFLKNKDKPLYKNIIKEHIVLYGAHNYIALLEKIL